MKNAAKDRVIIGALIHEGAGLSNDNHIMNCAMAFFGAAWRNYGLPKKLACVVSVESEPRAPSHSGGLVMGYHSIEALQQQILALEISRGRSDRDGKTNVPHVMLGIGSREFCQTFVHFLATGSGGNASNWGLHLLRMLTALDAGKVAWMDTLTPNKYHHGDIGEMFDDMKRASAVAS